MESDQNIIPPNSIIHVEGLRKLYGQLIALDDLTFDVKKGEIFGLLGRNGSGKTTTLDAIEGLSHFDKGKVFVFGKNILNNAKQIQSNLGVQLQSTSLIPDLTSIEQIILFGTIYGKSISKGDALEKLAQFNLGEKANSLPKNMSGGQQQRLALILALIHDPEIIILDEPTVGLDPQSRHDLWKNILDLKKNNRTIILTTHYIEEAELLCDRVGILTKGKIIALDTPRKLIQQLGNISRISIIAQIPIKKISNMNAVLSVQKENENLQIFTKDILATLDDIIKYSKQEGILLQEISIKQPSLEDYFLKYTNEQINGDSDN